MYTPIYMHDVYTVSFSYLFIAILHTVIIDHLGNWCSISKVNQITTCSNSYSHIVLLKFREFINLFT